MSARGTLATILLVTMNAVVGSANTFAHSGGLNGEGWHTNRTTGEYHAPSPALPSRPLPAVGEVTDAPAAERAQGIVKKRRSDISHGPDSSWYAQTEHYIALDSVEACLKSGGRLPKR